MINFDLDLFSIVCGIFVDADFGATSNDFGLETVDDNISNNWFRRGFGGDEEVGLCDEELLVCDEGDVAGFDVDLELVSCSPSFIVIVDTFSSSSITMVRW